MNDLEFLLKAQKLLFELIQGKDIWKDLWPIALEAKNRNMRELCIMVSNIIIKKDPEFWFARELPKHMDGYYSQNDQDKFIEKYFNERPGKFKTFIEVGAFDGVHYSNVRRLHEKYSWSGISIEPVSKNFNKLKRSYEGSRVICLNYAISDTEKEVEFNVSTYPHLPDWGSDVASVDIDETHRWTEKYGAVWSKEKVRCRTLDSILDECGIEGFDFITIDTEGHDLEALKGLDLKKWKPSLILVEYGEKRDEIIDYITKHNYSVLSDDGQDIFFASIQDMNNQDNVTINFGKVDGSEPYKVIQDYCETNLKELLPSNEKIKNIVIVGAYVGDEIPRLLRSYPMSVITVFEANPKYFNELINRYGREGRVRCYNLAISDENDIVEFFENNLEGTGSLLRIDDSSGVKKDYGINSQATFRVLSLRLDHIEYFKNNPIDLLWIDVQGAELRVLQGAGGLLNDIKFIFSEIWVTRTLYENQSRLFDLENYLSNFNFRLFGIGLDTITGNGSGNALWIKESHKENDIHPFPEQLINRHLIDIGYLKPDMYLATELVPAQDLMKPERFDIIAKIIFGFNYLLGINSSFSDDLYTEHLRVFNDFEESDGSAKSGIEGFKKAYHQILKSIQLFGFNVGQTLVPVCSDRLIIDGSHRVAACWLLNTQVGIAVFNKSGNVYDYQYFSSKGLDEQYLDNMAYWYCKIKGNTFTVTIFPSAVGGDVEVERILLKYAKIFYSKKVNISQHGSVNLMKQMYRDEPWLGDEVNDYHGARFKASNCYPSDGLTRVFFIECDNIDNLKLAKDEIRKLYQIENHSVHINDSHEETLRLAQIYLNENSIHFLNNARIVQPPVFRKLFTEYKKFLADNNADSEFFSIDGSTIMAAYGIRDCRDIDYLHHGYENIHYHDIELIGSHNAELHYHELPLDEIIFNPKHHFYFDGIKFGSIETLISMKSKRAEKKDFEDINLILTNLKDIPEKKTFHENELINLQDSKNKKIVGLVPARNEEIYIEQCLLALSNFTDAIIYLDDCSDDNSLDIVKSLINTCKIERIIEKKEWIRDEPKDRNALLQAGREIGGTHFIIIDADEAISSNLMTNGILKNTIYELQPGDILKLNWIQLWRTVNEYRFDKSVWTWNYKDFIFCDDNICSYESEFIHTSRCPGNLRGKVYTLEGYDYGVLHFQFVNWRNLLVKQAWYRCLERIRTPEKNINEINERYLPSKDEKDLLTQPSKDEWFKYYDFFDASVYDKPENWREKQIIGWFNQYGKEYFKDLDIWDVEWRENEFANSLSLEASGYRDFKSNLKYWQEMQNDGYFENHSQTGTWRYDQKTSTFKILSHKDLAYINQFRQLSADDIVLVIGCGFGREMSIIAPYVKKVIGIDVTPQILKKADEFLHELGIDNFELFLADEWTNGIKDKISIVYSITVFQHLTKDLTRNYIKGLSEMLSDDGCFICQFAELRYGTNDAEMKKYEPGVVWTLKEINELIHQNSFNTYAVKSVPFPGVGFWHWAYFGKSVLSKLQSEQFLIPAPSNLKNILDSVKSFEDKPFIIEVSGVQGSLSKGDIALLYSESSMVKESGNILEIGSFMGLSACIMAWSRMNADKYAIIYCIDPWGEHSATYQQLDIVKDNKVYDTFLKNLNNHGLLEFCIPYRLNSHEAVRLFENDFTDLLFVDGDHSYQGCKSDLENWVDKVKSGGVILCHDYLSSIEVKKAVDEFCEFHGLIPIVFPDSSIAKIIIDNKRNNKISEISNELDNNSLKEHHQDLFSLSAIISVYKSEKFIRGCLEDLINQTLFRDGRLEIIIIDSNSPENEKAIIDEFIAKYPNIVYRRTAERETVYQAWNRGIKLARGKYITNANTDDRHRVNALEIMADYLDENQDISVVYADQLITYRENETFQETLASVRWNWPPYSWVELQQHCILGPQPMWRKSLHDKYGYFDESLVSSGDYEFWLRIGQNEKIHRLDQILGLYYSNPAGLENSSGLALKETEAIKAKYKLPKDRIGQAPPMMVPVPLNELLNLPGHDQSFELGEKKAIISVIIPCYDRPNELNRCISSLVGQSIGKDYFEVIFINDGSPDPKIKSTILNINGRLNFKYIEHQENRGRGQARNSGLREAGGEYLLFLDSDIEAHPDLLLEIIRGHQLSDNPGHAVLGRIEYEPHLLRSSLLTLVFDNSGFILGYNDLKPGFNCSYLNFYTGCISIPAKFYHQIGGFNEKFSTYGVEDTEYGYQLEKAGCKIFYLPTARCVHLDHPMTPERFYARQVQIAKAFCRFFELHPELLESPIWRHYQSFNHESLTNFLSGIEYNKNEAEKIINELFAIDLTRQILSNEQILDLFRQLYQAVSIANNYYWHKGVLDGLRELGIQSFKDLLPQEDHNLVFSVIIPTYNRADILLKCLDSLNKQTFPKSNFEVIVIDDGSTDGTKQLIASLNTAYQLTYIWQINSGPAAARNKGIIKARGEYVLILNDDAVAAPDLLAQHYNLQKRIGTQKISVLGSFRYFAEARLKPFVYFLDKSPMVFAYPVMEAGKLYPYRFFWTCNISIRKEILLEAGLFDEDFREPMGEDTELGYRLEKAGCSVLYYPDARTEHHHTMDPDAFARRQRMNGRNMALLFKKHPEILEREKQLFGFDNLNDETLNKFRSFIDEHEATANKNLQFLKDLEILDVSNPESIFVAPGKTLTGEELVKIIESQIPPIHYVNFYKGILEGIDRVTAQKPETPVTVNNKTRKPLRILFTMYGWNESGGGTTLPRAVALELASKGHEVAVFYAGQITPKSREPYYLDVSSDNKVKLFGVFNRPTIFLDSENPEREIKDDNIVRIFEQLVSEFKPDIIHYNNFLGLSFAIADFPFKSSIPSVFTPHNYHLMDPKLYMFNNDMTIWKSTSLIDNSDIPNIRMQIHQYENRTRAARELLNDKIDLTLAISGRVGELFRDFGINPWRIIKVNQVPHTTKGISPKISKQFGQPLRFGFLGAVLPHKGVHNIVIAAQAVPKDKAVFKIYGFGSIDYINEMKKIDKAGKVQWMGEYGQSDLNRLSGEIDIMIVPSIWEEGAGMVIPESFAMGISVIGADIGGIPDYIKDGFNGWLYDYNSPKALAEIILRLAENEALINSVMDNVRLPYGFDDYITHLEKIYELVISKEYLNNPSLELSFLK